MLEYATQARQQLGPVYFGWAEVGEIGFYLDTLTSSTFRLGFHDGATSGDATDVAYLEIAATGVATGKTSNNATRSTTGTTYTLSTATWYAYASR